MSFLGQETSLLELAAALSGLASVWLTMRMSIWNWPTGIVSVVCYFVVFIGAKLYADAGLQIFFLVFCIYGWWKWLQAGGSHTAQLAPAAIPAGEWAAGAGLGVLAIVAIALSLSRWTDSPVPWADSSLTSASLVATWAQARRDIKSWWIWIAVDCIAVPLYWMRGLPLTSGLYFLFLLICIQGLIAWNRLSRVEAEPA